MRRLLLALLLLLAPAAVRAAGAASDAAKPRPMLTAFVRPWAQAGRPLRVELLANCTAQMPAHPEAQFHVFAPGGAEVRGRWTQVSRSSFRGFDQRRAEFTAAAPMAPGVYTVRGLQLAGHYADAQQIEVRAAPGDPPLYLGPQGLGCWVESDADACHPGAVVQFRLNDGESMQNTVWIVRLRRPNQPYLDGNVWIGTSLPEEFPPGQPLQPGRYIAALDQRDEADREGHYLCEVALDLPDAACGQFKPGPTGAQGSGVLLAAQCPRLLDDGSLVSAIDGFKLFAPASAAARQLKRVRAALPRKQGGAK